LFDAESQGRLGDLLDALVWYGDASETVIDADATAFKAMYGPNWQGEQNSLMRCMKTIAASVGLS
jgi:hypothetical protein